MFIEYPFDQFLVTGLADWKFVVIISFTGGFVFLFSNLLFLLSPNRSHFLPGLAFGFCLL